MATLRSTAAALTREADDLVRSADDMGLALAEAGKPFSAPLERATKLSDDVFESLREHSFQFGRRDGSRIVPEATRATGVERLDEAIRLQADAAQGIDDAFGSGTWMSRSVRETHAFNVEARRVLADPTLGPDSADHAIGLLRENGWSYDQAVRVLRAGNLDEMANRQMFSVIDHATPEVFERAADSAAYLRRAYTAQAAAATA